MPVLILIVGALVLLTAVHNSFGDLATALETDIPGYFHWALAIVAILALGYIPILRTPSRVLLGLVAFVILAKNYQTLYASIAGLAGSSGSVTPTASNEPTAPYIANPASGATPSQSAIQGDTGAGAAIAANVNTLNPLDPASYLAAIAKISPSAGFGGVTA